MKGTGRFKLQKATTEEKKEEKTRPRRRDSPPKTAAALMASLIELQFHLLLEHRKTQTHCALDTYKLCVLPSHFRRCTDYDYDCAAVPEPEPREPSISLVQLSPSLLKVAIVIMAVNM